MQWQWLVEVIGWIGSVEVVLAYFLVSNNRIDANSRFYQWLNLTGSIFLLINTAWYGAFPSAFVNLIWALIAITALYRIVTKQPKI